MGLLFMGKSVSNILLRQHGSADCFRLKWGWISFRLKIKPITASQLIEISGEISQLNVIDKDKEMFPMLMENSSDLVHISNAIAIATGTRWKRIVAHAILKLDLKDIQTLFNIVHKQSDPTPFFLICLQAGKLNLMKEREQ